MDSNKKTNIRWAIFFMLAVICTINYIDRAVISVCMPQIQEELKFSPEVVGVILSAFFWGYTLMQIPCGWLCDRIQPGKILVAGGILWGVFQMLTGVISSSKIFMFIRALLGASEAPMYPAGGKLQSIWLPATERSRGSALVDVGSSLGNAFGAPLAAIFMLWLDGWRGALIGIGILTMIVTLLCGRKLMSTPDTNTKLNQAERDYIRESLDEEWNLSESAGSHHSGIKFGQYFTNKSFWGMCLGFCSVDCVAYGLMTWGPLYLAAVHHLNVMSLGWALFVIYGIGVCGGLLGGTITDNMRRKFGKDKTNIIMKSTLLMIGIIIAISMYFLSQSTSIYMAIACMTVAVFFQKWSGCLYWVMPASLSQREHVGSVGGCMNCIGNIGGAVVPMLVGAIVGATGSYFMAIIMFLAFGLGIGFFPLLFDFNKKAGEIS